MSGEERHRERLKAGTLALGALAFGAGAAGADHLIGRDDISPTAFGGGGETNAGKKARASAKKKRGPRGPQGPSGPVGPTGPAGSPAPGASLLVSSFTLSAGVTGYVAPGTDRVSTVNHHLAQMRVPPVPSGGFHVRGLAVRSMLSGKGIEDPEDSQFITLYIDGGPTGLSCTTDDSNIGTCAAEGDVFANPGSRLSIQAYNKAASGMDMTVALSLDPA